MELTTIIDSLKQSNNYFGRILSRRRKKEFSYTQKDNKTLEQFIFFLEKNRVGTWGAKYWFDFFCFSWNFYLKYLNKDVMSITPQDIFSQESLNRWLNKDVNYSFGIKKFLSYYD